MTTEELAKQWDDQAAVMHGEAWRRRDGGQDLTIGAMLAEETAARLRALAAENARLKHGHHEIIRNFGDTPNGHMAAVISRAALAATAPV